LGYLTIKNLRLSYKLKKNKLNNKNNFLKLIYEHKIGYNIPN